MSQLVSVEADDQTRFSIKLDPATLHFIPLPSRYLISDGYYNYFTLLNQSLGSIYLAWEGLCGKEGLWGDIFLGTSPFFPLSSLTIVADDRYDGIRTYLPFRPIDWWTKRHHWGICTLPNSQHGYGQACQS
jgi:hypothetical protein